MRVITGTARGHKLVAPEGLDTRPTSDKIKESIFSAIQFDINGAYVLDLFAGSGQMGIEALSRGASRAIFVDNSPRAIKAVNENLRITKLYKYSEVINRDSYDYIKHTSCTFDIIILDPPYTHNHVDNILPFAAEKLNPGGCLICEYEAGAVEPVAPSGMTIRKTYKYGNVNVTILIRESNQDEVAE